MKTPYLNTSPYASTDQHLWYMDVMTPRKLAPELSDREYTIPAKYAMRPDLAAYELFGAVQYWWVFAQINKNTLFDPIYDFTAGTVIQVPAADRVKNLR